MQFGQLAKLFATDYPGQIRSNNSRSWTVFIPEHPHYTVTALTAVELRQKLWLPDKNPRIPGFGARVHLNLDEMLLDVFDVEPKMTQEAWLNHLRQRSGTRFTIELHTEVPNWQRPPIEVVSLWPSSALQGLYEDRKGQLPFRPRQIFPQLRDFARCLQIISKEAVAA